MSRHYILAEPTMEPLIRFSDSICTATAAQALTAQHTAAAAHRDGSTRGAAANDGHSTKGMAAAHMGTAATHTVRRQ